MLKTVLVAALVCASGTAMAQSFPTCAPNCPPPPTSRGVGPVVRDIAKAPRDTTLPNRGIGPVVRDIAKAPRPGN